MADLQSRPLIELNLDTREITITNSIKYYDIDKNIANIFLQIYREDNGLKTYLTKEELNSFVGEIFAIKPVTNDFLEITGVNTTEFESDNGGGVLRFIIPTEYTNRNGIVKCEIHVSKNNELLASDRFVYNVKRSLVTEFDDSLLEDADFPILQQLIKNIQKANNIDDENVSQITTYSSQKINSEIEKVYDHIYKTKVKVHFIDRDNKGDCMLIQADQKNIIIDLGQETDEALLIQYLIDKEATKIDYVILSHYHDDHIGGNYEADGLDAFINSDYLDLSNCKFLLPHKGINWNLFVDNAGYGLVSRLSGAEQLIKAKLNAKNIPFEEPETNTIIKLDNETSLRFLNADANAYSNYYNYTLSNTDTENNYTSYNNFSLVVELTHGEKRFLFTGDIEYPAQEYLVPEIKDVDVYKVEHHGVNKTTCEDYLYKIRPSIAVAMTSNPSFGIKDRMTPTYLNNIDCKFYNSYQSGNVIVTSNGKTVSAESERGETKVDNKFNYVGVHCDLKRGLKLLAEDDLNNYISHGVYYSENTAITNSLTNKPSACGGGFRLVVQSRQTDDSPIQIIIDASASVFIRAYVSNGWTAWRMLKSSASSIINARISTSYTTTSTELEKLILDDAPLKEGDGLQLVNGSVVIGEGINKVKISGQIGWESSSNGTKILEGYIYKNSTSASRNGITAIGTYFGIPLASKIIDVKAGDTISLYVRTRSEKGSIVSPTKDSTWLCVESV